MSGESKIYDENEALENLQRDKRNRAASESVNAALYGNRKPTIKPRDLEPEEIIFVRRPAPKAAFSVTSEASKRKEADAAIQAARETVGVSAVNPGRTVEIIFEAPTRNGRPSLPKLPAPRKGTDTCAPERLTNAEEMTNQREILSRIPGQARTILSAKDPNFKGQGIVIPSKSEAEQRAIQSLKGDGFGATKFDRVADGFVKSGETAQLQIAFEGVDVKSVGAKSNKRIADPSVPTWKFYQGEQETQAPHDFPTVLFPSQKKMTGVTLERVQAAAVFRYLREGIIDGALLAMPKTEEQEISSQWYHAAKVRKVAHVDVTGKAIATQEILGKVDTKFADLGGYQPEDAKFRVVCEMRSREGTYHLESDFPSEARARSAALSMVSFAMGSLDTGERAQGSAMVGGAESATIIALEGKLHCGSYPLTGGQKRTMVNGEWATTGAPVKAWDFSEEKATITRGGAMALEKDTRVDEYRGNIPNRWTKRHSNNANWTQRCRNDKSTFSGNRSVERGVRF